MFQYSIKFISLSNVKMSNDCNKYEIYFKRAFLETRYEQLNFHERQHKQADCGTIDCIVRKLLLRPALQLVFLLIRLQC